MQIHLHIHAEYMLTQWIKTSEDFFKKIYLSLYLKGLCVWEGVGDQTELQYIDPHSYGHQRCVFLVLQSCSTGWLGPSRWLQASSAATCHQRNSKLTDFLSSPSYIIVQSPTQYIPMTGHRDVLLPPSLASSGNNCHAVHRSLSWISLRLYCGILPCPIL